MNKAKQIREVEQEMRMSPKTDSWIDVQIFGPGFFPWNVKNNHLKLFSVFLIIIIGYRSVAPVNGAKLNVINLRHDTSSRPSPRGSGEPTDSQVNDIGIAIQ